LSVGLGAAVLLETIRRPEEVLYLGLFAVVGLALVAVSRRFEGARKRLERELVERGRVEGELREAVRSREAALRAMAESESRFETMADRAPVMVWMTGADGLGEWFNRPWLSFTARTLDEELGNGWRRGVHSDDRERCLATYEAAFAQREAFEMEYRLRRGDGEYRWLVERGVPRFASDASFLGYVGSCLDISDRREVERRHTFLAAASEGLASSLDYEGTLAAISRIAIPDFADAAIAQLTVPGEGNLVEVAHAEPDQEGALRAMEARYPSWSPTEATAPPESLLVTDVTEQTLADRAQPCSGACASDRSSRFPCGRGTARWAASPSSPPTGPAAAIRPRTSSSGRTSPTGRLSLSTTRGSSGRRTAPPSRPGRRTGSRTISWRHSPTSCARPSPRS
jgi:PAS domain S-box-containing protein